MRRPAPVLLLTATIAPDPRMRKLAALDPAQRLQEYARALELYLRVPAIERVVFAENSGSDLSALHELVERAGAAHRVEWIQTPYSPPELGRGVGEANIVRDAMRESSTLSGLARSQHVWKVTGRYVIRNLSRLAGTAPETDLYINVRRWPVLWCDTYAYAFTRAGYESYLSGTAERLGEDMGGERSMAHWVLELLERGEPVTPRLRFEPRVEGTRGKDLRSHGSPKQRLKYLTRVVGRRTARRVWI